MRIIHYLHLMTDDEQALAQISLSHGQARWVLSHFNMSSGEGKSSFDALLKSFRRDGIPFAEGELGSGPGHNVVYHFEHLMELALALAFRTQGILSRDFVALIAQYRHHLRPFFRRAYVERRTGLGEARALYVRDGRGEGGDFVMDGRRYLTDISGVYLDLALTYLPGGGLTALRCELLDPQQAVVAFMAGHENLYPRPPLPLSDIASDIVRLARAEIPDIRRGRA